MQHLFENWTEGELRNAIWTIENGSIARGGYPLEWYEDELYRRTGSRNGYHEADPQSA